MTCRETSYDGELADLAQPFESISIADLDDPAMLRLLRQLQLMPAGEEARLVEILRARPALLRMARNPLMLTIIAYVHTNTAPSSDTPLVLPTSRGEVYRQAIDLLIRRDGRGDRPRSNSRIAVEDQRLVLQDLALALVRGRFGTDMVTVGRSDLIRFLSGWLTARGQDPRGEEVLSTLVERVQMIVPVDAPAGRYRFRHATFRDALVAIRLDSDAATEFLGARARAFRDEVELVRGAAPEFNVTDYLASRQTPVFFGSAINNFGVKEVLDALVDYAPAPGSRPAAERMVEPAEDAFTGVVFKIQANMDPQHRDRIAFVRISSGRFARGMRLVDCRTGKDVRTTAAVSFLSQRRDTVDEGFAGDIIGIPNRGTISLGDALTEGEVLHFSGLPFFAPELFRRVELASPMKAKQLRTGLRQLGEEGAIQIFHPATGGMLLAAAGALQFEVAAHRLQHEYGVDMRLAGTPYVAARWISAEDPLALKAFIDAHAGRIALDDAGFPAYLVTMPAELRVAADLWPKVSFHKQREHAGYAEAESAI